MQTSAAPSAASAVAGFLTSAILADAAVETWIAGSPLRIWPVIAAVAWLLVAAILWRTKARWRQQLGAGALALLALLAITAWRPEGLEHGLQMLRQPTATLAAWSTALALAAAAVVCLRATAIPIVVRGAALLLAAYGVATFALGGWHAISYPLLLSGSGPWHLPTWLLRGAVYCGLAVLPVALAVSALGGLARSGRVWRPRQIVALALAMLLVVSGFTNAAAPQLVRLDVGATRRSAAPPAPLDPSAIADAASALGTLAGPASPSRVDLGRKAEEVGSDPAALFTFVHDTISTQVYAGVLRGARGALLAGAGNSWDQAALLADLLRHHGREVRFAAGRLAAADAAAVVERMFADASRQRTAAATAPAVPDSIRTRGLALGDRVNATWQSAHADIVAALESAGLALGGSSAADAILNTEAADHAWVEYRDGDRWVPLDPVARTRPGEAATTATETTNEIPEARQHRVIIRFGIETRSGQALKTADLLTYPTTAAALDGTPVAIEIQVERGSLASWRARPILFVGDRPFGQRWFTELGPLAGSGHTTIVGEASQQMGRLGHVTEAFGGPPAASPIELTAAWIEVEFSSPSGVTDTVRRDVFDRIGVAARAEGRAATAALHPLPLFKEIPAALSAVYGLAFTSGALNQAVVWEQLTAERETFAGALSTSAAAPQQPLKALGALPRMLWSSAAVLHALSQQLSARLRSEAGSTVFYEATPRLAIASVEIVPLPKDDGATASIALDLRRNGLRAVAKGASAAESARTNLARGVLDGAIEDAVAAQLAAALDRHPATVASLLAQARADGIRPVAWRGAAAVPGLALPDDPRARLQAAASDTTAIVAAPRPSDGTRAGWWQIDLRSGEATAVLDDGLHGARARIAQDLPEEGIALAYVETAPLEGSVVAEEYQAARYGSWLGAVIAAVITLAVIAAFSLAAR